MSQNKIYLYLTDIAFSTLLSFSLIYALVSSLGIRNSASEVLLISFVIIVLCSIVFLNKLSLLISGSVLGFSSLAVFYYIFFVIKHVKAYSYLLSFIYWTSDFINNPTNYNKLYEFILLILLAITAGIFIFFFSIKKINFYVLLISGALIFCIQWAYGIFTSLLAFYSFLFVILIYYLKYIYTKNISDNPGEFENPISFSLWSVPIAAFIIFAAFLLPVRSTPLQWNWFDIKIYQISTFFDDTFNSSKTFNYFSLSETGFGDKSNKLGGKVTLDKKVVMEVTSPRQIYLKGIIKDYYTGSEWRNTTNEKNTLSSQNKIFESDLGNFIKIEESLQKSSVIREPIFYNDTIKISYKNFKTKTIFTTSKIKNIHLPDKTQALIDSNGVLFSDTALKKDLTYSIDILSLKLNSETLKNILHNSRSGNSNNESNVKYLQLPENLPPRVASLAKSITSSAKNNYDKAKAIEEYLSAQYPYTLSPNSTPKGRDFVDYFLFEEKQGYCTYYASAMTVMLRTLGIPARYVEGYMMPSSHKKDTIYEVTNEQAHAWVEVYFQGFGWIPFEPTSPFRPSFYDNRDITSNLSSNFSQDPYYQDYIRRMQGYKNSNLDFNINGAADENSKMIANIIKLSILSLVLLLIVMFLGILLFNLIKRKCTVSNLLKINSNESVSGFYKMILNMLSLLDLKINPSETPSQFSERVKIFKGTTLGNFADVTNIYLSARYSKNHISDKEKKLVYDFYDKMLYNIKFELGKYRYFYYVNLLGRTIK